ncbi:MAG: DNA replication/repair protein RecF, partial [Vulcanococcus sp.]
MRQFRNYEALSLQLDAPRLLVIGRNGEGKSNLLEAVELLGTLRSHRCSSDRDLIRQGERQGLIAADCEGGDRLELELRRQGGRQARRNGKVLERQHELIGPLRCVGFSALDLELVRGEPALRRQWLDRVVLQLEPVYAELLSRYGRLLRQRSQLLRRGLPSEQVEALLEAFDLQMALIGTRLHRRRLRALKRLQPLALAWQLRLSEGREQLELRYQPGSQLEGEEAEGPWRDALLQQLQQQRPQELRLGQCGVGPHRDEVALELGGPPARRFGSAGQP